MLKKFCEKHNIFYGWVVVFGGILIMAVAYGIPCNCFSLYVKPVTEELGYTRQSFKVCVTLTHVVVMLLALIMSKYEKKIELSQRFGGHFRYGVLYPGLAIATICAA